MTDEALKKASDLLEELARCACCSADDQLGPSGWMRLVYDHRIASLATQAMYQLRVLTPEGPKLLREKNARAVAEQLHALRDQLPGPPWYGLYVIVRSDRMILVRYDYDINCLAGMMDDGRFYEDIL